ncbi:MAG TPA: glycosyltransferase family 2 protein [Burkholderiaceae bacterium]|nr:glycosyltransferase family 2 protein [Burkholderiaceae bacterium]
MSARDQSAPAWSSSLATKGGIYSAPIAESGRRSARKPSISCVVPAFNEAQNLPRLLPVLIERLQSLTDRWEVIIVDDGSRDQTLSALEPWLSKPGVVCLALSRNFGKEAALGAGLDHTRGDVVITLDADLQHPVGLLAPMLEYWREGSDMVYAVRADRRGESTLKRVGARLFYSLLKLGSPIEIPPHAGDFRLMDRCVVDALCALPERTRFMKGLYAWVGYRSRAIEFAPLPRSAGRSGFGARALFSLAASGITAFSNLPLRLASALGFVLAVVAITYGAWVVVDHFINGNDVAGWATIVVGITFLSGVQLLFIGILGEYLGRVYEEVKSRPRYIVARRFGASPMETPIASLSVPPR